MFQTTNQICSKADSCRILGIIKSPERKRNGPGSALRSTLPLATLISIEKSPEFS